MTVGGYRFESTSSMVERLTRLGLLLGLSAVLSMASPEAALADVGCPGCGDTPTTHVAAGGKSFSGTQVIAGPGGRAQTIGSAASGSSCPGCTYRLLALCDAGNGCRELGGVQCPNAGDTRYNVYVTRPGETEVSAGSICLGPGEEPVAIDEVTTAVRTLLDELIPTDAQVRIQPPNGTTLVNIPTVVRADGGRAPVSQQFFAAGFAVQVTALPVRWTWTFEPGATGSFDFPGAAYERGVDPTRTGRHVTHTYTHTGQRQVGVTVTWEASYDLPGIGTIPVGQVQRESAPVPLRVVAARSELVAG